MPQRIALSTARRAKTGCNGALTLFSDDQIPSRPVDPAIALWRCDLCAPVPNAGHQVNRLTAKLPGWGGRLDGITRLVVACAHAPTRSRRPFRGRQVGKQTVAEEIFGRDQELALVSELLHAVPDVVRALVIEGVAGIGKST